MTAALDASPSRIPVLLGGCGSGRTALLRQLRDRIGRTAVQHIDVERTATTPERFLRAVTAVTPFPVTDGAASSGAAPVGARPAFDATLGFFGRARTAAGEPATFFLDEFLELRTFESFPGLRRVLHDCIDGLAASGNRFVLTSRYVARAARLLRDRAPRFEVIAMPPLTVEDTIDILGPITAAAGPPTAGQAEVHDADYLARTVNALADGRPMYVRAIADELATMREHGGPGSGDAISALAALLAPDGRLARHCSFSYELRLHRARGYGALKAILEILAEEEGLTLTEISQRLQRTPGSTKDYLSWLEDVDLVASKQKRYSFTDPLLRVWVRLHCRASAPTEDDLAREVHRYALPRLPKASDTPPAPQAEPAFAMAGGGPSSGIIEID
ncbi:MAG TPA: helix-turn-helix domain-containing protein [Vicinamibacterales bacterium]|nr:helix-turn-helix domain-containing protein [Vicinamibacterales bacterium]